MRWRVKYWDRRLYWNTGLMTRAEAEEAAGCLRKIYDRVEIYFDDDGKLEEKEEES